LISEVFDTINFVLWNAFPWHPYKKTKGLLSNRTPTNHEMMEGSQVLDALLQAFDLKKIIALGNKAEGSLRAMGIKTEKVRHPAMGGAERFREQFFNIVQG
jgi:uracil-DNA glycosylase